MKILRNIFWYVMGAINMLELLCGAFGAFLTMGIISLPKEKLEETLENVEVGWDRFFKKL